MKLKTCPLKLIEEKYSKEKNTKIKQRLHIILLLREGYSQREVSSMLHIAVGKVPYWLARFEKKGFDGLKDIPKSGRPTKLSKRVLYNLKRKLKKAKSDDAQLIMSGWNTKQIRNVISQETGEKYTLRHVRRIAHKIGFSLITPRTKHIKRDEKKIQKFKEMFKKNLRESIKATPL